jgi:mRNA interferase RelE/StbE
MKMHGNKTYSVIYEKSVIEEDIPALPKSAKGLIKKAIEERLMTHPVEYGKPLRFTLKGLRRIRVSMYRIVYEIDEKNKSVKIITIKNRKDVYE